MKKREFDKTVFFRSSEIINNIITYLMKKYPYKYQTKSQVIRASLIRLKRSEDGNSKNM